MKKTKLIFALMVVLTTLLSWWMVPALVKKMTDSANHYPLVYYSSVLKELCIINFRDQDYFTDIKGNKYPHSDYDSLLPILNFRQLQMNGQLPDSIDGHAMDLPTLRMKQVIFRYAPEDAFSPKAPMGVLMEAMPKRMGLKLPGDYFRLDDRIEFIDSRTNRVDQEKSRRFNDELLKKGFAFPAVNYWGNPNTRKPYEEGYFCLDSKGDLYHMKMVNGRPFVKNTGIGKELDITWFAMSEVMDKRFYGYVFGADGEVGIVESIGEGAGYRFLKMDLPPFDIRRDNLTVIGNMLYWSIEVTNEEGMTCYGLDAETLESLSSYHMDPNYTLWDRLAEWLFVCQLSPVSEHDNYISIYSMDCSAKALLLNLILALVFLPFGKKSLHLRKRVCRSLFLLVAGLPGVVALAFLPPYEKN